MTLEDIERDLLDWGLVEREGQLVLSKRFRGALMRAAAQLQQGAGQEKGAAAIAAAVELALASFPLPAGAVATSTHRAFLVAVEIESLPPAVRQALGV